MGLRINTNVISIKGQRFLGQNTQALNRALERLTSGSRINRAGDDAAGLAISEGLQSQVRGLRAAVRNANDAVGFLNTAEGGLSEMTNITQRLRELAIQAANGTLSVTDRSYLGDEADALVEEFERIANQTQFNGVALLDGSFQTTTLQVGVNKGETISFNIGDARASSIGALATKSGYQGALSLSTLSVVSINGVSLEAPSASDDPYSFDGESYSAISIARKINEVRSQTSVKAEVLDNIVSIYNLTFSIITNVDLPSGFKINNVTVSGTSLSSADAFVEAINDYSNATGVKARLKANSTDDIELYAEDGRNIILQMSATTAGTISTGGGMSALTGAGAFYFAMFGSTTNWGTLSATGFIVSNGAFSTSLSQGTISQFIRTGSIKLVSADDIVVAGTGSSQLVGFTAQNVAVDYSTAINTVDLSDADTATDALAIVDAALVQLAGLRASLGVVQNRLDSTASNIGVSLENISAARSQIRDSDVAVETAELTRAQILQQAGIAVLAQANTSQQAALQLLRFS